jgi:hypothetical protein
MKITLAPPSTPLCSSRYIWKPLTMSVPSWVKMPVRGARNPILSSCACAGSNAPNAMAAARHNGGNICDSVLIMSVPSRAGAGIFFVRLLCGGKC